MKMDVLYVGFHDTERFVTDVRSLSLKLILLTQQTNMDIQLLRDTKLQNEGKISDIHVSISQQITNNLES